MNPQYKTYIIIITVIALGIVGYIIYRSKTQSGDGNITLPPSTPTVTSFPTPFATFSPTPSVTAVATFSPTPSVTPVVTFSPTPSVTPVATFSPTPSVTPFATFSPTPSERPFFATTPPPKVTATPTTRPPSINLPTGTPPQVLSGKPVYWDSFISFKNISSNKITIQSATLICGVPGMPVPPGMTAAGSQGFNIPIVGDLFSGNFVSFRMPSLEPGVAVPGYGVPTYNCLREIELTTTFPDGTNTIYKIGLSGANNEGITFSNVPTTNIIVLQSGTLPTIPPVPSPSVYVPRSATSDPIIAVRESNIKYDFSGVWEIVTINGVNKSPVTLTLDGSETTGIYEWSNYRSSTNSSDKVKVQYNGGTIIIVIINGGDEGKFFKIYKTADGTVQFFGAPSTGYFFARDNTYKLTWSDPNYTGN